MELPDSEEIEACTADFLQIASSLVPMVSRVPHKANWDEPKFLNVHPSHAFQLLSQIALVSLIALLALCLVRFAIWGILAPPREKHRGDGISMPMMIAYACTMLLDYICTDQYQPSMPAMAREFHISQALMGSTIQLHVFSNSITMLFAGPISDRLGRRPMVLASQLILATSTLACGCATNFAWFAAGRVLQGMAASVGSVILATMQDAYNDEAKRMQATSFLVSIMTLGPLVAPSLGGLLADAFGWRFPFLLLSFCSVVVFLGSLGVVEETAGPVEETLGYLDAVVRTLSSGRRLRIMLCAAFGKSVFDIFTATNGFILEDWYDIPLAHTSLLQTITASSGIVGSSFASSLPWPPTEVMSFFSPILVVSAASMAFVGLFFDQFALMYLVVIGINNALLTPPLMSMTTEFGQELRDIAGLASSMMVAGMNLLSLGLSLPGTAIAGNGPSAALYAMAAIVVTMPVFMLLGIVPGRGSPEQNGMKENMEQGSPHSDCNNTVSAKAAQ